LAAASSNIDWLVARLGGWPDHFTETQKRHGESILAEVYRERRISEGAFGLVIRYAVHRAAFDALSAEIAKEEFDPEKTSEYLSGKEQSRAFHENKLLILERELLATPWARSKNGESPQTSFWELLEPPKVDEPDTKEPKKVLPFQKMSKKKYTG